MRNAILSLLLSTAVMAFFSFTNGKKEKVISEDYDEDEDSYAPLDTVPQKKDSSKASDTTASYHSSTREKARHEH